MSAANLNTPEQIAHLIEQSSALGNEHMVELLRPVMQGQINLTVPMRETRMPPLHRLGQRPLCVIVGDDDYRPAGPATWACAAKLRAWCAFAVVHGAGAQPEHYAMAAQLTLETRRLLLIETTSAAAQDWAGFLRQRGDLKLLGILPIDGPHPVVPAKGAVH